MDIKEAYKVLLEDGVALEQSRVTASKYTRLGKDYYQIHSDNYKCRESYMFKETQIDEAIEKFVELLKKSK